ncbi:hypothetical protein Gotri_020931 [Gossypium trilobum]|uniref:Uncharacterized protein n=1 Tax=Gossypium trilobum TaxID=34281 RepID=A0A7J9DAV5_9ROSI|nr:hypothetical protein [Gossypium trilobum]
MGDSISEPDEGNQTSFKDIFFREDKRVHSLVEKSRCLTEIVNLMGRRVQVNALLSKNINNGSMGHFVRIIVVVDLEKPLILKIWIDGMLQQVEYKCLPKFDTCPIRDGNYDAHESNNKEVSLTLVVD